MTATDELRELLDERGVEWEDMSIRPYACTSWRDLDGELCTALEGADDIPDGKLSVQVLLTPEQAVEATLGRETCHAIVSDNLTESEGTGDAWADCSECGHLLFVLTDPSSKPPHYCPNCGRRVVGE